MNEITLTKQSAKKKEFQLIFFVLFSLFTSENVIAQKHWSKNYVEVGWVANKKMISMRIEVYDYKFGRSNEHGYLEWCEIEASNNGVNYCKLLEIYTSRQNWTNKTIIHCKKILQHAYIEFLCNALSPGVGEAWPNRKDLDVSVSNLREYGKVTFGWYVGTMYYVRYLRISGKWASDNPHICYYINMLVYPINLSSQSMLNSKNPGINRKVTLNNTVKILKKTEAILVKGADLGENIRVYTTSGIEVKSVITDNDVVKIKLPVKQIYIVHVGKSQFKIAL